ncbi:uncharacterized protein LOC132799433 [Ziziphus jujuba]|uniref:Uncharacterized protein LOC132799433 n=1 Tax=Ziziphus jujuba TaxID=326968 RepID=A0ABM3ZRY3_ZIZJJ|nr:uncharacterized protein LOC132799433 [Ziziphus jujuba]
MAFNALEGLGLAKPITTMITMMMQKKPVVLYHYPDKAFAVLAAHLFFFATCLLVMFFRNTVCNPIASNQLPLAIISNIYLLDFVDPSGFVQEISSKVSRVVVLDHYKTAVDCGENSCSVGENVERVIDIRRSGATIVFDYFEERAGSGLKDLNVVSMRV